MALDWRNLPSLSSLRAFELTARCGNFAAAAAELNVTHAAIAQRVRALEADLGASLVRRAGRSVVLTEVGEQLAGHLTEGFETIAAGVAALKADQSETPVQLTATVHVAQSVVMPRLYDFWQKHPEIQISVLPSQEVVDLAEQGIDLAIRISPEPPNWPGLHAEPLFESDVIAVGAPCLVHDNMPPLQDIPWIWARGVSYEEEAVKAFGVDIASAKNVDLDAPFMQIAMARQGLGLSYASEIIVRDDLAAGTLVRVPVPSPFSLTYYAVTPVGPVRPQAAVFAAWLKKELSQANEPAEVLTAERRRNLLEKEKCS